MSLREYTNICDQIWSSYKKSVFQACLNLHEYEENLTYVLNKYQVRETRWGAIFVLKFKSSFLLLEISLMKIDKFTTVLCFLAHFSALNNLKGNSINTISFNILFYFLFQKFSSWLFILHNFSINDDKYTFSSIIIIDHQSVYHHHDLCFILFLSRNQAN